MWTVLIYCSVVLCIHLPRSVSIVPPELTQYLLKAAITQKHLVVHLSRLGLANRLRSMADWFNVASIAERYLVVVWDITDDCKAGYHDLFGATPQYLVIDNDGSSTNIQEIANSLKKMNKSSNVLNHDLDIWVDGSGTFVLDRKVIINDVYIVLSNYDGVLTLDGVDCEEYTLKHGYFLNRLKPQPMTTHSVIKTYNEYFANSVMVGVHYRAHDPQQDWAVVPPLLGDRSDKIFGEGATIERFIEVMRNIDSSDYARANVNDDIAISFDRESTEAGLYRNSSSSRIRFFVASNSLKAKGAISKEFPSAIYVSSTKSRSEREGMILALFEWLLLSRSAFILHTYGSTFAQEAALVHQLPLVGIWDGKLLHHTNAKLPFCGNQQYGRILSKKRRVATYQTGINTDQSEVN